MRRKKTFCHEDYLTHSAQAVTLIPGLLRLMSKETMKKFNKPLVDCEANPQAANPEEDTSHWVHIRRSMDDVSSLTLRMYLGPTSGILLLEEKVSK